MKYKLLALSIILLVALVVVLGVYYDRLYYQRIIVKDGKAVGNDISDYLEAKYKNTVMMGDIGEFWCPAYEETNDMKYYATAWEKLVPEINKILEWNKIKANPEFKDSAIFHFRCSDSPFDGDRSYALLPKEYYQFVTDILNQNDKVKKLYVVTNFSHHKLPLAEEKCPQYLDNILDWIEEKASFKIERAPLFLNVKESYEAFLGAEILFNSPSSFSFIPGVTKGKKFITSSMIGDRNIEEKYNKLPQLVHWTMWDKFDCIPHSVNYNTYDYKNNTT